jgi:hypothetical protein
MIGEALTLGAIGSFVKDLALDPAREAIRERVKQEAKGMVARRNPEQTVFRLYQNLENLAFTTSEYVEVLQQLTHISNALGGDYSTRLEQVKNPSPDAAEEEAEYWALCRDLHESLKDVLDSIKIVSQQCARLGIGIEIHQPELISTIRTVGFDRSQPLPVGDPIETFLSEPQQDQDFWAFVGQNSAALEERLHKAESNLTDIKRCCIELREFLASQFSFREMISLSR